MYNVYCITHSYPSDPASLFFIFAEDMPDVLDCAIHDSMFEPQNEGETIEIEILPHVLAKNLNFKALNKDIIDNPLYSDMFMPLASDEDRINFLENLTTQERERVEQQDLRRYHD